MIEQHETIKIKRSQVNFASYNPRKISSDSKKKIENNLKEFGLMGGIVWNERTGNLVSGHQRVSILDKQNGYKKDAPETDYDLLVTKVNLTDEQEKAQNIFFNNKLAQGYFDESSLKSLMGEINNSEWSGFSKSEQVSLFQNTDISDEEYQKLVSKISDATSKLTQMKQKRGIEIGANYVVLVFKNSNDKENLINNLGIPLEDNRFCNGEVFLDKMYENWEEMHE